MFAIQITEENLPAIFASCLSLKVKDKVALSKHYINHRVDWYFVSGYQTATGKLYDWNVIPEYVLEKVFEYDPVKIQTQWDIIVRKD